VDGELKDAVRRVGDGEFRGELGRLRGELGGLRGELGGLRGELGGLRGELGELRGELGELGGELCGLRGELCGLRGELGELRGELGGVIQQEFSPSFARKPTFLWLCACARRMQHHDFEIPSSSNPSVGFKGADKATFLSMI